MGAVDLPDLCMRSNLVKATPADDGSHGRFHRLVAFGGRRVRIGLFGFGYGSKKLQTSIRIGVFRWRAATYFMMRKHDHQRVENGSEVLRAWFQAPAIVRKQRCEEGTGKTAMIARHHDGHDG